MVVKKPSSYEKSRLERLEENKKRMEALNLPRLSLALQSTSPKSSPMKKSKPRIQEKKLVAVRRSSRLSNHPYPVYKEVTVQRVEIPRRISKRRDLSNRVYASDESRAEALAKAEKLQDELGDEYPKLVKSMLPSHVSGGFWLGLPVQFCRSHLPKQDSAMTLIDEEGEVYETIYLARKTGLSGGWLGFAVAHDLADGDALVFQLVRPSAFKVYITRASGNTP
ncbi:PREDICTED: B3 domain-containing protein At5g42700-like [Tarenaya hassleriana]|uniref:B3 domain-containing protein At5g42700-like n=1 Tax=Tarenaya hassleriana TaxID=28532 RepID=UPI00053C0B1C|nr:PREDICTED: B3 domain-containing protein At5g42700-like [Tarenaya hassleriana]